MLNKKDPLVNAIQQIMQNNQVERNAVNSVNEKFGITDRKALPHERQGEWDSAYQSLLKEELHPNQKKLDLNKNRKLDRQDFEMIHSMKEQNMPKTDPYAEGQASSISVVKPKEKSVTPADQNALTNKIKSVVKEATMSSDDKKKARMKAILKKRFGTSGKESVSQSRRQDLEEKITKSTPAGEVISDFVHSKNPKFEGKSKKERMKMALGAYYSKHPEKSNKVDEGFNNRHNSSVNASVQEQVVAEAAKARSDYGLGAIRAQKNAAQRRASIDKSMEPVIDTVAPFIPGVGAARAIDKYSRGQQSAGQTAADVGLNLAGGAAVSAIGKGIGKGFNYLRNLGKTKKPTSVLPAATTTATRTAKPTQTYTNAADELSDTAKERMSKYLDRRMGGGSSSASTKPAVTTATQTTTMAGQAAGAARRTGTNVVPKIQSQTQRLPSKPADRVPGMPGTITSRIASTGTQKAKTVVRRSGTQADDVVAAKPLGGGSSTAPVASANRGTWAQKLKNTKISKNQARAIVAGSGITSAASLGGMALMGNQMYNKPPAVQASSPITATTGQQARMGGNPTGEPRTTGTMARRKIEAQPREVSAKEIMTSKQYTQGVKDVGGEAAARKIQPGTNVAGVGPIAKGETIYGNVKKQLSKTAVPGFERGNTKGGAGR